MDNDTLLPNAYFQAAFFNATDGDLNNNNNNPDSSTILGFVALVVSMIALFTTILQVVQQYLASATDGYRRCTKRVMNQWAAGTFRSFRWNELRFEVLFETPVIFLAKPSNDRGPMGPSSLVPIYNVTGTDDSCEFTNTEIPSTEVTKRVHTADDETASWILLLYALQREERESRDWERRARGPPKGERKVWPEQEYTITHQIQKKKRSWDFMPSGTTKPFATTTICHLVEMTALLGMYWKHIDIQRGDVSAEGNGFIFSSTLVRGLGLMTFLSVTGSAKFEANRVIPCDDIKRLAFGVVPSIMDRPLDVGTLDRVKRTLATFSCTTETITLYEEKKQRTYMFSVTMEIVAMLAKPFRLRNSMFRMLPNPTGDGPLGNVSKLSLVEAMERFQSNLADMISDLAEPNVLLTEISQHWTDHILPEWTEMHKRWAAMPDAEKRIQGQVGPVPIDFSAKMDIELREVIHDSLDLVDAHFSQGEHETDRERSSYIETPLIASVVAAHLNGVLQNSERLEAEIIKANSSHNIIDYYFSHIRGLVEAEAGSSESQRQRRGAVWAALVYRLICWFLLHDFDIGDVNIVPSELMGSRMPVFIG